MSLYDYKRSLDVNLLDFPFAAIIMAAMRQADSDNLEQLRVAFPEIYAELRDRIEAPCGVLPEEL